MAETSYPYHEGEIDLTSYWVEKSIQSEIQRGEKLRQQKLLEQAKEVTSKFSRKPSLARSSSPPNRKPSPSLRRNNGLDDMRKRSKSNSPSYFYIRAGSAVSGRSSRSGGARRGRPVCSMRISQLAEPSKRQCIETWRNKANVLPGFMVHRLKQQIMDQKPVVKVSDAITCFKYDKASAKKRPQRKINTEAMKLRELEENQNLSVIFGNRLAQKLLKPTNVTLIPRLRSVSTVVTGEICCVMKDRQRCVDYATHRRMVREISDKVTIWIADILEDTTEKLLEEDLRVKKMNERMPVTVNGEVITLMNTMVAKETELEEQEGPALDVLEDVVDTVLDICAPSVTEDGYDDDSDKDNLSTDYISVSSGNSVYTDIIQLVDDDDSIRKHLMNQLLDIIGTIQSNEHLDFDDSIEGHPNVEEKQSTSYLLPLPDINDQNKKDPSPASGSYESIFSQNKDLTASLPPDDKVDEEMNSNVSDTLEMLSDEEKNKKVTFSHDNIGSLIKEKEQMSIMSNEESYLHTEKVTAQVTSETSLSTSLRGVYDSWPNDLPTNAVKPSASANKSITSLGRILESDEINLLSLEVEVTSEQLTPQPPENIELSDNSGTAYDDYNMVNDVTDINDWGGIVKQELIDSDDKINQELKKSTDVDEHNEEHDPKRINESVNQVNAGVDDAYKEKKDISEIESDNKKELIDEAQYKELKAIPETVFKCEITKKDHIPDENVIQFKDKDFKSMNKICISHDSSKQSLVSVMLFELQKHGAKLKDFVAVREQSRYISKMCVQCECPKSDKITQKEQLRRKIYQRHSRGTTNVVPKKFDYRVQPKTAPAWLTRGQGEPGGNLPRKILYPGKNSNLETEHRVEKGKKSVKEREREIQRWCNDLDKILMNLSKWKAWLEFITKYITTLKQKAETKNLSKTYSSKVVTVDQLKPPRTIDKDVMWTKLNQRVKGGLKLYRNDETIKFKILPAAMAVKQYKSCVCTKQTKQLRVSSSTTKNVT